VRRGIFSATRRPERNSSVTHNSEIQPTPLAVDHARDGEVMIAYAMNGEPLPLLNGFPLRLVVPGWYAT
jgi:DMSO/TMAO reductase YedYZ molybdopterin-dependent catalytic subunit